MRYGCYIPIVFAALLAAPSPRAQDAAGLPHLQYTDMGQYPSVLQGTGVAVGGAPNTQFQLRCGYAVNGTQVVADPATDDLILAGPQGYTRYQYINGYAVITGLDPSKPAMPGIRAVKVQATDPSGTARTKSCSQIVQTDTLQGCTMTQTFMSLDQATASMNALQQACAAFMGQLGGQINPATYDAQKTQAWKVKLAQTLALIEQ